MSTPLAIAGVTYVIKDLLNNGFIDNDVSGSIRGNVNVTALPPDRIDITPGLSQLNIYLYRVTQNQGWRNVDLPSYDSDGNRTTNPPLSLNLHYLLTSYGAREMHSEILLGFGMQLMHETPVLDRKAIRISLRSTEAEPGHGLPDELKKLSTSELAEQIEQIKITPENLSTEEISKLWTAFGSKYRPTAAYQVSVVLIESKKPTKSALRVKERNIYVSTFRKLVIEKIKSQAKTGDPVSEDQPILSGYNLVICGQCLKGDNVKVDISGTRVTPEAININDNQIFVQVPLTLPAGIHTVQVIHYKMMGSPPVLHQGTDSNVAAFILSPQLTESDIVFTQAIRKDPPIITMKVIPNITDTQRVTLFLNEYNPDPAATDLASYSFQAPAITPSDPPVSMEKISIPVYGLKFARYLVRIRVDGAESPLLFDDKGYYFSPTVKIP
jgi:hypothetical protein